jgi:hypothetical protein
MPVAVLPTAPILRKENFLKLQAHVLKAHQQNTLRARCQQLVPLMCQVEVSDNSCGMGMGKRNYLRQQKQIGQQSAIFIKG